MNDGMWIVSHNQTETYDELIASIGISLCRVPHQYFWTVEYKIVETIYNDVCAWLIIYSFHIQDRNLVVELAHSWCQQEEQQSIWLPFLQKQSE